MKLRHGIFFLSFLFSLSLYAQETQSFEEVISNHRETYLTALLNDERAPFNEKQELKNIQFYEANENMVIKCLFIRKAGEQPFEMPTYSGETKPYVKYGELLFEIPGKGTQKLTIYQSLKALRVPFYKEHLFIPFKDLTNGQESYGGGRYIDLKISDIKKGIVELDFNKAYNPWCAYSEGFSCPVPPVENHLNVEIPAGEKDFLGEKKTM